ncbi:M16 family metallopeptidase [Nocardioides sp. Leaf307]|uniref:M16 family metallopeptidase n=1 Tax=Nocardioides sp. Leaf307 TaxID=1736331 RepID=UPI0009E67147|nr:pitrilysin family protein [Nocardioides sp. Leaf307]
MVAAPRSTRPSTSGGSTASQAGAPGPLAPSDRGLAARGTGTAHTLQTVTDAAGAVVSLVRRTVLPGGLRVITEHMAGVRSASIGVWVGVGSRDEDDTLHGCSHFLEHLLFKGTAERSALDISIALDAVGGEFNAFTAKEYTCFHARVLDDDLPLAVDVLGDMITASRIDGDDVEAERDVILDEIAMHDDDPDDVVHNLFAEQAWGSTSPLGRSIAGTEESITAMTRERIVAFYRRHYRPATMVVAVAGNVDHDVVVAQVGAAFGRGGFLDGDEEPVTLAPGGADDAAGGRALLPVRPGTVATTRPFEQVNVVLGMEGITRNDPRRFALGVINTALGGGTSSRLFQEVRERRGLAYSVYSFESHHLDSGLVGVSVGCLPAKLDDVLAVVRAELARVAAEGITAEELERGKGMLRGGLVLGLEDSGSRMSRLGKAELVYDELLGIDEVIERIDAVTLEETRQIAAEIFARPEILAVVGPA